MDLYVPFILILVSLLGGSASLARLRLCRMEDSAFLLTAIFFIILYISSFLALLMETAIILFIAGILLFIFESKKIIDEKISINKYFPLLWIALCLTIIFGFLVINDITPHFWDDFTHWAVLPKLIFFERGLPQTNEFGQFFPDYLPSTSLFSFLFQTTQLLFDLAYQEKLALMSQAFILMACFVSIIYRAAASKWLFVYCNMLFVAISFTHVNGFATMMIEHVMGFFFATCVCLCTSHKLKSNTIVILLGAVALALFKGHGIYLALVVLICFTISNSASSKDSRADYQVWFRNLGFAVPAAVIAVFLRELWSIHVNTIGADLIYGFDVSWKELYTSILSPNPQQQAIINSFIYELTPNFFKNESLNPSNPFDFWIYLFFIGLSWVIFNSDYARTDASFILTITVGLCCFLMGLLMLYIHGVDPVSASRMTSFTRFLSPFFIALICMILVYIWDSKYSSTKKILSILMLTAPLLFNPVAIKRIYYFISGTGDNERVLQLRSSLGTSLNHLKILLEGHQSIGIIWQCPKGIEAFVLSYDLIPHNAARIPHQGPVDCNSLPGDTPNIGLETSLEKITKFNYLLLATPNPWLINKFSALGAEFPEDSNFLLYSVSDGVEPFRLIWHDKVSKL